MQKLASVNVSEKTLIECCEIMIKLLGQYKDSGVITQEEYAEHIKLKIEFLKIAKPQEQKFEGEHNGGLYKVYHHSNTCTDNILSDR